MSRDTIPRSDELLISPTEAARRLGLAGNPKVRDPHRTVLAMASRGQIVAVRVGRFTMIDPRSLASLRPNP